MLSLAFYIGSSPTFYIIRVIRCIYVEQNKNNMPTYGCLVNIIMIKELLEVEIYYYSFRFADLCSVLFFVH